MSLGYTSLGPESGFPTLTDPVVDAVLEQARAYQTELDYTPSPSGDRLREIIQDLDAQWPYIEQPVMITGNICTPVVEASLNFDDEDRPGVVAHASATETGEPEMKKYFVSELPVQSTGFDIEMRDWPETIDGHVIGRQAIINLSFKRALPMALENGDVVELSVAATAPVTKELALELPYISNTMAEQLSHENYPLQTKRLEKLARQAPNIGAALSKLRAIAIPSGQHIDQNQLLAFEQYCESLFLTSFDEAPSIAVLKKNSVLFGTGENQLSVMDTTDARIRVIVVLEGLRLFNRIRTNIDGQQIEMRVEPANYEFRARVRILGSNQTDDTEPMEIRLRDFAELNSLRSIVYQIDD